MMDSEHANMFVQEINTEMTKLNIQAETYTDKDILDSENISLLLANQIPACSKVMFKLNI